MGIIYYHLTLLNPTNRDLSSIEVKALADTGAMHLCTPEHIALQFGFNEQEKREVTLL